MMEHPGTAPKGIVASARPVSPAPPAGVPSPRGEVPSWEGSRGWVQRGIHRLFHPTWLDVAEVSLVLLALLTVESAYRLTFIPPGGDSGHWVVTSYSFLGRTHPADFTDQAFLYPPLTFAIIAPIVLVTNDPLTTSLVTGGLLLVLYGATTIHLARRFLPTPNAQLLFVGMAVLNGTTLQILFWGGFPNFLGFSLLNEAMVCLLAAFRTRGVGPWVGVGVFASALYLSHDLSLVMFVGGALVAAFLVLVRARGDLAIFAHRGTAIALGIFAVVYGTDGLISRLAGVSHPGYLFSNPATYVIDPIGLIFRPFFFAPAFFPSTSAVLLSSPATVAILIGLAVTAVVSVLIVQVSHGPGLPVPLLIAVGWCVATLAVPAVGYLVHVDTDYPRFAYFFPLPVALAGLLSTGWAFSRWRARRSVGGPASSPTPANPPSPSVPRLRSGDLGTLLVVILLLTLLYATVTLPSVIRAESGFQTPSHDSDLYAAAQWIGRQPGGGAVLTDPTAARWVEALSDRTAYSSGPSWLHFYAQQILDDNLAYWSMSGHYVVTDNLGALTYSGYNASGIDAFPQYVAYLEGVEFPVLRIVQSSLTVNYSTPTAPFVSDTYSAAWGTPVFTLSATAPLLTARFTTANFTLNETATLLGDGTGDVQLYVLPVAHVQLRSVSFQIAAPTASRLTGTVALAGIGYSGSGASNFTWSVRGPVGALPGTTTLTTTGTFSVAPNASRTFSTPALHPTHLLVDFDAPRSGFALQVHLAASGLSNPAVTLPSTFDARAFLVENDVRFLLVQNVAGDAATVAYFQAEYGFVPAFQNTEWSVYEA